MRLILKYIEEDIENFNTRLISRGYPEQMVEKTLREVKYKDRKEALKQESTIAEGAITFCVAAGIFCRWQVAGCRLKFNYNWKTAALKIIKNLYTRQGFLHKVVRLFQIVKTRSIRAPSDSL